MVAFEDNFWGEKYNGFEVLHTNFKQGIIASKEFLDYVKERISVEEAYAKSLQKIANKCPTAYGHIGSFEPCWKFVQSSTEKLASIHLQVVQNLNEVVRALKDYSDAQKEKHRQVKDEFTSMSEMVQTMQSFNASVAKAKEAYQARSQEAEKLRKDCASTKDIPTLEKAEKKVEKSCEEYKNLIERREATRIDYEKKFTETTMKFESLEHDHLNELLAYLGKYGNCLTTERVLLDQIIDEFSINMDAFKATSLLEQFVCAKQTGKDRPAPMEFEEVNISVPPVDVAAIASKEAEKRKAKKDRKTRKKKEKSTANGSLQTQEGQQKAEVGVEVDEDGYSIRPPDADNASLKSGKSRDSFSSNSGSDSDDDEPRKIQVKIKPKEDTQAKDISIDALKTLSAGLTLSSPGTVHKKSHSALDLKSKTLSRSNNALLDLEQSSNSDTASIKSLPSSSSLDMFQPTFLSTMSDSTSKDNSVGELDNLFNAAILNSSPSVSTDWASELGVSNEIPKSTSEAKTDINDVPPPLPAKHRTLHEESATLPRSSRTIGANDHPSLDTSKPMNDNSNIDRPVPLPRLKTISGGQHMAGQFPSLAPPVSRRNTAASRMQNRPLPPPPQPAPEQKSQSSMLDLMDIFTTPAPSVSSSLSSQHNSVAGSFRPVSSETAATFSSVNKFESSNTSFPSATTLDNQQSQNASSSVSSTVNTSSASPPTVNEKATPIAVAFIETVSTRLKIAEQSQPMVKVTGDMTISFPATILPMLLKQTNPTVLKFDVRGTNSLEQILPNKKLVENEGQLPGGDTLCYKFNMAALTNYLKEQSEKNIANFYNIEIIKYQVRSNGMKSIPLQLRSYWRCDEKMTDLKIDYECNPIFARSPSSLSNVSVIVPVNGGVEIMHSKPSATWSGEHQRATWKIAEISEKSENKGSGCLRARFEVSSGPSTPTAIAVQFSSEGSTLSNMNFDLKSPGYKLSLVKKKFVTGRYFADPVTIADKA